MNNDIRNETHPHQQNHHLASANHHSTNNIIASAANLSKKLSRKEKMKNVFKTKKFKDQDLEILYKRYFFKQSQQKLTVLMLILILLCIVLTILNYIEDSKTIPLGIILGIIVIFLVGLEIWCNWPTFMPWHLVYLSFVLICVLFVMEVSLIFVVNPRTSSEAVWCAMFFIYMVYTMMPIRMKAAVVGGFGLAVCHVIFTLSRNHEDGSFLIKQVCVCILSLLFSV